jgi:hypothetical protein
VGHGHQIHPFGCDFIYVIYVAVEFFSATTKPDPLRSDRYRITDSKGNHTGTLKRDPMDTRRILRELVNGFLDIKQGLTFSCKSLFLSTGSGDRIRTCDLRVMSPFFL